MISATSKERTVIAKCADADATKDTATVKSRFLRSLPQVQLPDAALGSGRRAQGGCAPGCRTFFLQTLFVFRLFGQPKGRRPEAVERPNTSATPKNILSSIRALHWGSFQLLRVLDRVFLGYELSGGTWRSALAKEETQDSELRELALPNLRREGSAPGGSPLVLRTREETMAVSGWLLDSRLLSTSRLNSSGAHCEKGYGSEQHRSRNGSSEIR